MCENRQKVILVWNQTWVWEPFWKWITWREAEKYLRFLTQESLVKFIVDSSRTGDLLLQAMCCVYVVRLRSVLLKLPTLLCLELCPSSHYSVCSCDWPLRSPNLRGSRATWPVYSRTLSTAIVEVVACRILKDWWVIFFCFFRWRRSSSSHSFSWLCSLYTSVQVKQVAVRRHVNYNCCVWKTKPQNIRNIRNRYSTNISDSSSVD